MNPPARQIGAFELQEILGRGGMGEVWLALHTTEWLPVAIKLVTLEHATHTRFRAALRREAESLARVQHAHIAALLSQGELTHDVGDFEAGTPYIITEYVEGFGLESLDADLPYKVIRRLLLELLDALAHVHAHNIVHRDIKPENVLVQGTPARPRQVKLVDFGIAHLHGRVLSAQPTSAASFKGLTGTPAFMAPELILNHVSDVGPWTDLYAVGCLAWQLLTGAPPFTGTNFSVIQAQLYSKPGEFRARGECPEEIVGWLHKLLHKNGAMRFARAADAARALLVLPVPTPPLSWRGHEDSESGAGEHSEHTLVIPELKRALWRDAGEISSHHHTLPATWHRPHPPRPPQRMLGADLSLWGIRELPMIGHDRARTTLWELVHEVATARRAQGVLIEGPAGCGKSRLARWLMVRAHEVGAVEVLQWSHRKGDPPHTALSHMLRQHLKLHHDSRPRLIEHLQALYASLPLPGWAIRQDPALMARILAPDPDGVTHDACVTQPFDTPAARYQVVARYLCALASRRPVLMVLDEAQWGHDALACVEHMLGMPQLEFPILIVVLTRAHDLPALSALAAHPSVHTVTLEPLPAAHMHELIEELLISDAQLIAQISRYSQGIPLSAIGLIQEWIAQRKLLPSKKGFALAPNDRTLALPDQAEELWVRRVDALIHTLGDEAAHQHALWLAAALGPQVDVALWREVCGRSGFGDPGSLYALLKRRDLVVEAFDESSWSFVSALLHAGLVGQAMARNQWALINLRCADAMRAILDMESHEVMQRIAHHYMEAEAHEEALSLWERLLERALRSRAFPWIDEALAGWHRCNLALHLGEEHPMVWRHVLWRTFVSAIRGDSRPETVESTLGDLQQELDATSFEHALASECMAQLAILRGDSPASRAHLRAAAHGYAARGEEERCHEVEFTLMNQLAAHAHTHEEAREIGASLLARDTSERRLVHTHMMVAELGLLRPGSERLRPPRHDLLHDQLMHRVRALDDARGVARLWTLCGDLAMQQDAPDEAVAHYTQALTWIEGRDELWRLEVQLKRAMTQLAQPQWKEADAAIQQLSLRIKGREEAVLLHAALHVAQLTAHLKRRDLQGAQRALERCSAELSRQEHRPRAQYHIAQALLHAAEVAIGLDDIPLSRALLVVAQLQWLSLGSEVHTRAIAQITRELG